MTIELISNRDSPAHNVKSYSLGNIIVFRCTECQMERRILPDGKMQTVNFGDTDARHNCVHYSRVDPPQSISEN